MKPADYEAWRNVMGLSNSKAAEALGVSKNTITRWRKGRTPIPHWAGLVMAAVYHKLKPWGWKP